MVAPSFSPDYLRSILKYNFETGEFIWLRDSRRKKKGEIAGSKNGHRYWTIWIDNVQFYRYDLAWYWFYGIWPTRIDHKDRVRDNDKIDNLRETDRGHNRYNAKVNINSESGIKGVRKRYQRWQARFQVGKFQKVIGTFDTKEQAEEAYKQASEDYYENRIPVSRDTKKFWGV